MKNKYFIKSVFFALLYTICLLSIFYIMSQKHDNENAYEEHAQVIIIDETIKPYNELTKKYYECGNKLLISFLKPHSARIIVGDNDYYLYDVNIFNRYKPYEGHVAIVIFNVNKGNKRYVERIAINNNN